MTHLHIHSNHSLLEGVATPRQLVARAVEHGMKSLALTDTAGLYAAIPFYKTAREADIKPILGAELRGTILLARNREGYAELCRILTDYHCSDESASLPMAFPKEASESAASMIPPLKGGRGDVRAHEEESLGRSRTSPLPPFKGGMFGAGSEAINLLHLVSQISGENLFLLTSDQPLIESLIQRGQSPLVALTNNGTRESRARAARLHAFAIEKGLRPVAVNPVYFLDPHQTRTQRVLAAIRHNTTVDSLALHEAAPPDAWFRTPYEMRQIYADWPDALDNTLWVAEQCNVELALGKPLFPQTKLDSGETPFSMLWKQTFEGIKKRYQPLTSNVIQRLQYELEIIDQLGFAPYFLIVWDIVCYARAQGIPIVGRGSAANSIVAYALGITRVDPFKYDLYFERFLNPSRTDCPDIDLDICWLRRDEVIDYVYKKYGADRVAMIATFNTLQARSAMRETAKTFGLTDKEAGEIVRQLPHYRAGDIRSLVKFLPECRHLQIDQEPLKSIVEISETIDGYPRHLSIHSGGVVIAPEPLTQFVPLQRAAKGILITQYDMHPIEELGLIKMDLLGHRSLTVIQETVELVRRNTGIEVDVERLPDPDKLTAELIRNARTIGCFQIESPAMRALLKSVRAGNTDMLIKTLSLIRPGPSGSGMKKHFIDRHLGREEIVYLHPALEKVLGDTYGVMLYQEDILKVANVIAGMNLAEADGLRRAMTKRRTPKEMAKSMKLFLEKATANGVGEAEAEAIWGLMANFAEYSYCKAHASTYGEIAYQCTYLKAHFPAEFLASVLSNRGGFYYPAVYLEEARRTGIAIRPPDVNKSDFNCTAEGDAIRIGFIEIRNLTQNAVRAIIDARKQAPFRGMADLCVRAALAYADAEILIQSGACDGFGHSRPEMLWQLKTVLPHHGRDHAVPEQSLFTDDDRAPSPHLPNYSRKKCTDLEWSHYGLLIANHPIEYYLPAMLERPLVLSSDMPAYTGAAITMLGWLIAERRVGLKGRGAMKFLTFEDPAGIFEAVLFPKIYQQYGHLLTSHGPYFITGEIQDENGYYALTAAQLERVGHNPKFPHHSDITPPLRWIFPYLREQAITQAD